MKSWKLFWVFVVAGTLCSGFLTACGKKSDDSGAMSYGSLNSDGINVSSQTTVDGMPLGFSMSNFSVLSTGYGGATTGTLMGGYCYLNNQIVSTSYCSGAGGGGQVRFDMALNGYPYPVVATSTFNSWQVLGNWEYSSTSICTTANCSIVIVSVVLYPTNAVNTGYVEIRQFAVKKDIANNRVLSLREFQLTSASMAHTAQMLSGEM